TMGYTPDLVVGVWVGNATNEAMRDVTGLSGAGAVWHYFMRTVLAGRADMPFVRPSGLEAAEVCALSGLLPTEECPYRRQEWFIAGTEPQEADAFYRRVSLDAATGLLANEDTPPQRVISELALDLPPQFHPWARAEGLLLLDDLLLASGSQGDGAAAQSQAPLRMAAPDAQTLYRLSPTLPPEAQRLRVEAVAASADLREVTLWLDGEPLATLTAPPYEAWWPLAVGEHEVWATAVTLQGEAVRGTAVTFTVNASEE
ncbi:MAG: hypothetical protein KC415_22400, partial [Anaerolineales bacterium]|nr:hypothetical protein [Anaerolineales bacterium]